MNRIITAHVNHFSEAIIETYARILGTTPKAGNPQLAVTRGINYDIMEFIGEIVNVMVICVKNVLTDFKSEISLAKAIKGHNFVTEELSDVFSFVDPFEREWSFFALGNGLKA